MTAAQDFVVRELLAQINAKNNERATDPTGNPDGQIVVTSRNEQIAPAYTINATLTKLTAGALTVTKTNGADATKVGVTTLQIPAEIAAGDTVAFDTPGAVTISATVPKDYPNPGGYDRRLVVYENNPSAPNYGRMFAVPPGDSFGVPFPGFTMGATRPTAGSVMGQAFYDTTRKVGLVWDGSGWREITASPIAGYDTDALLLASTTSPTGTYAVARDTGNLYVRTSTGWRPIGIKQYASEADMLADSPATGSLAEVTTDGTLWERTATGWRCMVTRVFATTADMDGWTTGASAGDRAFVTDIEVNFVRIGATNAWRPTTIYEDTEANIRAATGWPKAGQEAIAIDTGRTFVFAGGAWTEEPINHYALEADLLAATPPNGVLAWAEDSNGIFARANNAWITVGAGLPWRALTQAQYNAIAAPDARTLYIITGP